MIYFFLILLILLILQSLQNPNVRTPRAVLAFVLALALVPHSLYWPSCLFICNYGSRIVSGYMTPLGVVLFVSYTFDIFSYVTYCL